MLDDEGIGGIMGLLIYPENFDHDTETLDILPRWSYSGFGQFREKLASQVGIELHRMEGFTRGSDLEPIPWSSVSTEIEPLLHHSDCDGILTPEECGQIMVTLNALLLEFPDGYDRREGYKLLKLVIRCHKQGVNLEFG